MPRRKINTDNWVLPDLEGNEHRFTTYIEGVKHRQSHPDKFSKFEDVSYKPRPAA